MNPTWLHVRATGHGDVVLGQCKAADLTAAYAILAPERAPEFQWTKRVTQRPVYEYVISQASYAIGRPKALPAGRCTSCGHREAEKASKQCLVCRNGHRRMVEEERRAKGQRRRPGERRGRSAAALILLILLSACTSPTAPPYQRLEVVCTLTAQADGVLVDRCEVSP